MIHRVVLPKNGVESCQQFNGDVTSSLAMLYDDVRRRTFILVIKLSTILFLFVVVFVLISASIETPSDNTLYPYLTSKCTVPLNIKQIRSPCCNIVNCFL